MEVLITNLVILGFILILVFSILLLWLEIRKQKHVKSSRVASRSSGAIQRLPPSQSSRQSKKDSTVKSHLVRLLHGDRQAVDRLIQSAKLKQPGKSTKRYEEKVLHDLERDRR